VFQNSGTDISDYFNYGFNEETWKAYLQKQVGHRVEQSVSQKIRIYESGNRQNTQNNNNQNNNQNTQNQMQQNSNEDIIDVLKQQQNQQEDGMFIFICVLFFVCLALELIYLSLFIYLFICSFVYLFILINLSHFFLYVGWHRQQNQGM
jgi:hypothetical protein